MKALYLLLFATLSLPANAGILDTAAKAALAGNQCAERLDFLITNLHNCSSFHFMINNKALKPGAKQLAEVNTNLLGAMSGILDKNECPRPEQLQSLKKVASEGSAKIGELVSLLRENHQRLLDATETSPRYPNCVATIPGDTHSSAESLAYLSMRSLMEEFHANLDILLNETNEKLISGCAPKSAMIEKKSARKQRSPAFLPSPIVRETAEDVK